MCSLYFGTKIGQSAAITGCGRHGYAGSSRPNKTAVMGPALECPPGTDQLPDRTIEVFVGAIPDGHTLPHFLREAARCARVAKLLGGTPPPLFLAVEDWIRAAAVSVITRRDGVEVCLFMVEPQFAGLAQR